MQERSPASDTRGVEGGVNVSDPRSMLTGVSILSRVEINPTSNPKDD